MQSRPGQLLEHPSEGLKGLSYYRTLARVWHYPAAVQPIEHRIPMRNLIKHPLRIRITTPQLAIRIEKRSGDEAIIGA
jgi:hypothetical protein